MGESRQVRVEESKRIARSRSSNQETGSEIVSRSPWSCQTLNRCDPRLVPVVLRLERPVDRDAEVLGLLRRQLRQLHAELGRGAAGRLPRRASWAARGRRADTCPVSVHRAIWASTWLVNELRHDERRMARRAAEVHQPAFGQQDDRVAVGERVAIDQRLDVRPS